MAAAPISVDPGAVSNLADGGAGAAGLGVHGKDAGHRATLACTQHKPGPQADGKESWGQWGKSKDKRTDVFLHSLRRYYDAQISNTRLW